MDNVFYYLSVKMKRKLFTCISVLLILLTACRNRGADYQQQNEDKQAKEMLQGLWTNGENSDPAMLVKGDSIFLPWTQQVCLCASGSIKTLSICKVRMSMDTR